MMLYFLLLLAVIALVCGLVTTAKFLIAVALLFLLAAILTQGGRT